MPFPGIWFPFPPPPPPSALPRPTSYRRSSPEKKKEKEKKSPPSIGGKGAQGLLNSARTPRFLMKMLLVLKTLHQERCSVYTPCLFYASPKQKPVHYVRGFDLQTLKEKRETSRPAAPGSPNPPPGAANPTKPDQKASHATTASAKNPKLH